MTDHSPTPWKYEVIWGGLMTANYMPLRNGGCNSLPMGFVITHGDDSETHAAVNCASNAALICRAVNAHDDLVAACRAALENLVPGSGLTDQQDKDIDATKALIKAALAKAGV